MLTRIQYYSIIRKYEEQAENRDVSIQYPNVGTLFEEKEFEEARRELLSLLSEKRERLVAEYFGVDVDESTLSKSKKRLCENVQRLVARMENLQCKIQQKNSFRGRIMDILFLDYGNFWHIALKYRQLKLL